jgi:hypothetical protein
MKKFSYSCGLSLLGLTTLTLISDGLNQQVLAKEEVLNHEDLEIVEPENNIKANISPTKPELIETQVFSSSIPESQENRNISYSAADLQPEKQLVSESINLDESCQSYYPYSSRCSQNTNTPENKQQLESEVFKNNSGWAITPEVSTLGVGATVTKSLTSKLNARVALNTLSLDVGGYQKRQNEVAYDANLNLLNVSTLVDYHPFKNSGFRVSTGLVFNDNNVEGKAQINDGTVFEYDGNTYTNKDIASLKGKVSFPNNVAPYLGIGWGNAVKPGKRWGFSVNLGVIFAGSPQVDLEANIVNESLRSQIVRDLEVEKKELEDELKPLSIYPVLSLGVSYHF